MSNLHSTDRDRLVLALDFDDLVAATRMASLVKEYFGVVKVGLELYSAAGPDAVEAFLDDGFAVFADLKLFDIPTTVRRASKVIGGLGAKYLTIHGAGGESMLSAGAEGLTEGALEAGLPSPLALGVTVLTSDPVHSDELVAQRCSAIKAAGCGGLVCSAADLEIAGNLAGGLLRVVPGIRPLGSGADDQLRSATPSAALNAGADLLVIGRAVTGAQDPALAAKQISLELADTSK